MLIQISNCYKTEADARILLTCKLQMLKNGRNVSADEYFIQLYLHFVTPYLRKRLQNLRLRKYLRQSIQNILSIRELFSDESNSVIILEKKGFDVRCVGITQIIKIKKRARRANGLCNTARPSACNVQAFCEIFSFSN